MDSGSVCQYAKVRVQFLYAFSFSSGLPRAEPCIWHVVEFVVNTPISPELYVELVWGVGKGAMFYSILLYFMKT